MNAPHEIVSIYAAISPTGVFLYVGSSKHPRTRKDQLRHGKHALLRSLQFSLTILRSNIPRSKAEIIEHQIIRSLKRRGQCQFNSAVWPAYGQRPNRHRSNLQPSPLYLAKQVNSAAL
jgi:hypothetical protein